MQFTIAKVGLLLGVAPLWVCNHNTVGENGNFQHLYEKISCKL